MISNRDIGFVSTGQDAEIKVDTFNFARYGLLHGMVTNVSQDAIVKDKPPSDKSGDTAKSGALSDSSEPEGQELVYSARVALDETQKCIDDRGMELRSAATKELGARVLDGLSGLVRTAAHDDLERVGCRDHIGLDRDEVAAKLVRVAVSVVALVMASHDGDEIAKWLSRPHSGTITGVPAL